jgi:predicted Ser/Thr protein kinase
MPRLRPLRSTDPREVSGFALEGRLGEGGQGVVYLGVSPSGEQVAVKLLHARLDLGSDGRRRFHRELEALQRVAPFCTARVVTADPDADPPYVVSEYIDGPSLQQAVRDRGVLAGADLDRLAIATTTALGAVHAAGVVHRDFKPANVLLAADGPRVIDFGISRPFDTAAATTSGIVGTPGYMSPEQLSGHPAGPPLDMFAWACTLVFAANGRPPFGQEPLPAVIYRILNAEPDLGVLDGRLRGFVAACLDKDPGRRPTARQVLLGLMDGHGDVPAPGAGAFSAMQGPGSGAGPVTGPSLAAHGASTGYGAPPPDATAARIPASTRPSTGPTRRRVGVLAGVAAAALATAAIFVVPPLIAPGDTGSPSATPTATPGNQVARTPRLGLEFWQDGAARPLSFTDAGDRAVTTVALGRRPFELHFPTLPKDTALQVCAWTDDSVFSLKGGLKVADLPCFRPGTGLADYEYGSGTLFLNDQGHNHLVGTRVVKHDDARDKVLFSTVFQDGESTPITERRADIYLALFIDLNGDGTVGQTGEYEYAVLTFPS